MNRILAAVCCIFGFLFSGCPLNTYDLPLHHATDCIVKVELCDHSSGQRTVLLALEDSEIDSFAEQLSILKCYRYYNDPPTENDNLSIYLFYENGDIDILGTDICHAVSETSSSDGWYYIDSNSMWNLFSLYVDPTSLPAN